MADDSFSDKIEWDTIFKDDEPNREHFYVPEYIENEWTEVMDIMQDIYVDENVTQDLVVDNPQGEGEEVETEEISLWQNTAPDSQLTQSQDPFAYEATQETVEETSSAQDPDPSSSSENVTDKSKSREGFKEGVLEAIYTPSNKKTAKRYSAAAKEYLEYCKKENRDNIEDETTVCNYFYDSLCVNKTFGLGSVWNKYSCLNNHINKSYGINLNSYRQLRTFMTNVTARYVPKKSGTMTFGEFQQLTQELRRLAEDGDHNARLHLIAVILMWYGMLRAGEVFMITVNNVTLNHESKKVRINFTAPTKTRKTGFAYMIPSTFFEDFVVYISELNSRCGKDTCFLKRWSQKKHRNRNAGKAILDKLRTHCEQQFPRLKGKITHHMWRRSAATTLADNGANSFQIKMAGRWNTIKVAEGYVAESQIRMEDTMNLLNSETPGRIADIGPIVTPPEESCKPSVSKMI